MKLYLIMMFVFVTQARATITAQTVSLSLRNVSLQDVMNDVKRQTGYGVIYVDNAHQSTSKLSILIQNAPMQTALDHIFKDQSFTYEISEQNIVIRPDLGRKVVGKKTLTSPVLQVISIRGRIEDEQGNPLAGVTVKVEGTGAGISSDQQGNFVINAEVGDVLIISLIGFDSQRVRITRADRELVIVLAEHTQQIEETVVTALGIKRSERGLNYNVQQVEGEELTKVKDANFVNSLVGKVAGVTINSSSAGIGGAARVVMRGTKSITGNNNAMYVIDGVPVINNEAGLISDIFSANTSTDIMSTINPEDIESVSVLTGTAATSLYGRDGQNGVIVINTKSGRKDGQTRLGAIANTMFFDPFVMPQFQNTYGQADEGSNQSWGSKLATPSSYSPRDFFQTGNNSSIGTNFSSGTERSQTYFTVDMVKGNGIIPNNTITRYNVSARNTTNFLNDRMVLDLNTRYTFQNEQNMMAQGLYHNPLVPIYLFPPGDNIEAIKIYERYNQDRLFPTQYWPFMGDQFRTENPWWIVNRQIAQQNKRRLLLSGSLRYRLLSWLNVTARGTMDHVGDEQDIRRHASTDQLFAGYGGAFEAGNSFSQRLYSDIMANVNKTWGDYALTATLGGQRTENKSNSQSVLQWIPMGSPPNVFTADGGWGNARRPDRYSYQSLFSTATVSYRNFFFLDGSHRVDWDSRLYFNEDSKLNLNYSAVGLSTILTDIVEINPSAVSYIKLRANYSEAGNAPRIYIGGPQAFLMADGRIQQSQTLHLPLRPERTQSWEVGGDFRFLNDALNLTLTMYKSSTFDQIFNVMQSTTRGGYSSFYLNAGKVQNRGIEAVMSLKKAFGSFKWNSNLTYTLNENTVKELYNTTDAEGSSMSIPFLDLARGGSYLQRATVGRNLSAIYTTSQLKHSEQGYIMLPLSVDVSDSDPRYVGNADPKYTMGWNNSFSYKNFNLSCLVFARIGGVGVSATQAMMDAYGVSQTSADARDRGEVQINGYPYQDVQSFYTLMGSGLDGVLGYYVYSATNVRLREMSLSYKFPDNLFGKGVKGLTVSATGTNLFMIYNKAPFDPESTASAGTHYQGIDYFRQPSLRGFGFSVNAQF